MEYANKSFAVFMDSLYVSYGQIIPRDPIKNQDKMQAAYHIEDPIENIFGQIKTGREFTITGNVPFYDRQLADMGISQILSTQE